SGARTRSSTRGRRALLQGLSLSRSLAFASSRIGGSTVLSAANIHVIAQARMALRDTEDDRSCLEQGEVTFLVGRNLAEGMKRQMRGFLHRTKRNRANLVGLADFFKRPANARITRQSLAAIGRAFKGGNDYGHGRLLLAKWAPAFAGATALNHSIVTSKETRRPLSIMPSNFAREPRGNVRCVVFVPAGSLKRARSSSSVMPLRMPSTAMAAVTRGVGRQLMPAGAEDSTRKVVSTSQLSTAPLESTTQVSSKGTSAR